MTTETSPVSPRALVEHSFGPDGRADLATVYDVAGVLGLEDQPVRLAVRRLVAAGVVEQTGRGRAGALRLAPGARVRGALDLAYWDFATRQDDGAAAWDGLWRLVAFSVPESRRSERDALRSALAHLGAAPLAPGLVVSPHDLVAALVAELGSLDVREVLTTATAPAVVHAGRDLTEQVPVLWPLDVVRAGYDRLDAEIQAWRARLGGPDGASVPHVLAARIALHAALDRAVVPDPLLPPELLPTGWPGPRVRGAFRTLWSAIDGGTPVSVVVR